MYMSILSTFWLFSQNPDSHANDSRFSMVTTLHSEILLVGAGTGRLYSWPCKIGVVNPKPHPLMNELGLTETRIVKISSSEIRCSLITDNGGVVTFYDSFIRGTCMYMLFSVHVFSVHVFSVHVFSVHVYHSGKCM